MDYDHSSPAFPSPAFPPTPPPNGSRKRLALWAGGAALVVIVLGVATSIGFAHNDSATESEDVSTSDSPRTSIPSPAPTTTAPTTTAPTTTAPTTPASTPVPVDPPASVARGDLGIGVAMTVPSCDHTGIVVLYSATDPSAYGQEVSERLDANPGAQYLRTDNSCSSLRQQTTAGSAIYAVYRVAGTTAADICAAVDDAGGDAYGKWLDLTTDPSYIVPC